MKKRLNNLFNRDFLKPYFFILFLFIIFTVYLISVTIYSNNSYKQLIIKNYKNILNIVFEETENNFKNIALIADQYSSTETTKIFLDSKEHNHTDSQIVDCMAFLNKMKNTLNIIDNVTIIDRTEKSVVSTDGYYPAKDFYGEHYSYTNYSYSYWSSYLNPLSAYQILPPTTVKAGDVSKDIIPIVFNKLNGVDLTNLLVINIDINKMITHLNDYKLTDSSSFYILNNQSNELFPANEIKYAFLSALKTYNVSESGLNNFPIEEDGQKFLVIAYSPSQSIFGYTYMVSLPYKEINKKSQYPAIIIFVLGIIMLAVIIILSFKNARIYTIPMEKIKNMLTKTSEFTENSSSNLPMVINEIIEKNIYLKKENLIAMPIAQQKILTDYLNNKDYYVDDNMRKYLNDALSNFKNEYFLSIIINLTFTTSFFKTYTPDEQKNINSGIIEIIKSLFTRNYEISILHAETNVFYVLVNADNPNCKQDILLILDKLNEVFAYDNTLVFVQEGVGSVQKGVDGLTVTHREAIESISEIRNFKDIKINTKQADSPSKKFIFSSADENSIYSSMLAGNTSEAKNIFSDIVAKNISRGINGNNMLQLYIQIINCCYKVMRMKNMDYLDEGKNDLDMLSSILVKPNEDISKYIFSLIESASCQSEQYKSKAPIQEIIQYITKHYADQIGLAEIADEFNISSKYLSQKIKTHIGISFHEYLSDLRIDKSKEMLTNTKMSITEIYESVGFSNRNTYIRTFKSKEGIPPSEYRSKNKSS